LHPSNNSTFITVTTTESQTGKDQSHYKLLSLLKSNLTYDEYGLYNFVIEMPSYQEIFLFFAFSRPMRGEHIQTPNTASFQILEQTA